MRFLFQGDSITDAKRDKRNYHDMGNGYPKYATALIKEAFPSADIEFINQGISGNRTGQLFDRLYPDAIAFEPDVISILIGINDIWHRHGSGKVETTDEQIALNYRTILTRLKAQTNAKIVMVAPFLLDNEEKESWRPEVDRLIGIVRKLADEFADVYIPLDELFAEALKTQPEPQFYSGDGVHPNENGAKFIGKLYFDAIAPLLESML
ncbi:MAG: GDSL family lipase [Ruminococcaceae bacterium]|nr:GDSL family lipase [Oscillospiraceae bacterium]